MFLVYFLLLWGISYLIVLIFVVNKKRPPVKDLEKHPSPPLQTADWLLIHFCIFLLAPMLLYEELCDMVQDSL